MPLRSTSGQSATCMLHVASFQPRTQRPPRIDSLSHTSHLLELTSFASRAVPLGLRPSVEAHPARHLLAVGQLDCKSPQVCKTRLTAAQATQLQEVPSLQSCALDVAVVNPQPLAPEPWAPLASWARSCRPFQQYLRPNTPRCCSAPLLTAIRAKSTGSSSWGQSLASSRTVALQGTYLSIYIPGRKSTLQSLAWTHNHISRLHLWLPIIGYLQLDRSTSSPGKKP